MRTENYIIVNSIEEFEKTVANSVECWNRKNYCLVPKDLCPAVCHHFKVRYEHSDYYDKFVGKVKEFEVRPYHAFYWYTDRDGIRHYHMGDPRLLVNVNGTEFIIVGEDRYYPDRFLFEFLHIDYDSGYSY